MTSEREALAGLVDALGELFLKVDGCPRCGDGMEVHGVEFMGVMQGCGTGLMLKDAYEKAQAALEDA